MSSDDKVFSIPFYFFCIDDGSGILCQNKKKVIDANNPVAIIFFMYFFNSCFLFPFYFYQKESLVKTDYEL